VAANPQSLVKCSIHFRWGFWLGRGQGKWQ